MSTAQMHTDFPTYDGRSLVEKSFGKGAWLAAGITILYIVYNTFFYFEVFPLLSVSELVWNALVSLIPARLVFALDTWRNPGIDPTGQAESHSRSEMFALKSEALRRVFGLETGALKAAAAVSGIRRASWLGGVNATQSHAPPGLGNWDNSCYQNSVLQGLSAVRSLTTYLDQSEAIKNQDSSTTAGSLRETMSNLNDAANNGRRIWTPAKLKSMSSWQQQDAQEYFSKIMDDLEKETAKVLASQVPCEGLKSVGKLDPAQQHDTSVSPVNSEVKQSPPVEKTPLDGNLAQRVACLRCGFSEGLSMIPFNCLTVPLGSDQSYDLAQCLDSYTSLEEISGVECAKCTLLQQKTQLENMAKQKTDPDAAPADTDVSDKFTSSISLPPELRQMVLSRLDAIQAALDESDFSDATLSKKCQIPKKARVSSTKTRQAVVARAPTGLVIHINRSMFDEYTGAMRKNIARVEYPKVLDLRPWCLGTQSPLDISTEEWRMNPAKSMIAGGGSNRSSEGFQYILRAAVCHYGRHENGHYICYREHPELQDKDVEESGKMKWWRLSDDDVNAVTEEQVLGQGGVFMLFYERMDMPLAEVDTALTETASAKSVEAATSFVSVEADNNAVPLSRGPTNDLKPEAEAEKSELVSPVDLSAPELSTTTSAQAPEQDTEPVVQPGQATSSTSFDEGQSSVSELTPQQSIPELVKLPTPPTMRTARRGSKRSTAGFEAPYRVMAAT